MLSISGLQNLQFNNWFVVEKLPRRGAGGLLGISAVWQATFNNRAEKCRRGRWKGVCLEPSKERWEQLRERPSCYRCTVRRKRSEGWKEGGSTDRGDNKESVAVCETHSTGVRCCDSPWLVNPTEVKGQWSADVSYPSQLVTFFHFLLIYFLNFPFIYF